MEFLKRPQIQRPVQKTRGEGCKIKIKNTSQGKTISFEGQCTREQLEMAKVNLDSDERDDE
jgi:hypothetical protein